MKAREGEFGNVESENQVLMRKAFDDARGWACNLPSLTVVSHGLHVLPMGSRVCASSLPKASNYQRNSILYPLRFFQASYKLFARDQQSILWLTFSLRRLES